MYDWMTDALADDRACVVTANRRLARTLVEHFSRCQLDAGRSAWRRPNIHAWDEWLVVLADAAAGDERLPVRITAQQSRVLWERCLAEDISDPLIHIGSLARLCRDTWQRLHEWCVPMSECQQRASGQDQRIFARAAGRYAKALDDNGWIDRARFPNLLIRLVASGTLAPPTEVVLAGFDRVTPQADRLIDAMVRKGARKSVAGAQLPSAAELRCYENVDAELRAAGAWARARLEAEPECRVAVVVSNLEQSARHSGRMLREGLTPGWQYAGEQHVAALDVSYGSPLADYPAIHIALLFLRWLHDDLSGTEVSRLLLSRFLGAGRHDGRCRLELKLRDIPDRQWSRALLLRAFDGGSQDADTKDWLNRVAEMERLLAVGEQQRRPSDWAALFDEVLRAGNWPGDGPLSSADYQLVNRWRELLNEFSRIELVRGSMSCREAVSKLTSIAAEAIFQPESAGSRLSVLGPLEAAGMCFDQLWVVGLAAADWPPPARPLVLVARDLQREFGMPDATPDDTAEYAERILRRLRSSASEIVFSYPSMVGDAEQTPTDLLRDLVPVDGDGDPGWHAHVLSGSAELREVPDRIPPVASDEKIAGGAATINRYFSDPFGSFAYGRLGVRWLQSFRPGIAANVRGSLIHAALYELYRDQPTHTDILAWTNADVAARVRHAVANGFRRHLRYADAVLEQLLKLEIQRTENLLQRVIAIDRQRDEFVIESVENDIEARIGGIHVELRCDRIDRLKNGERVILDYKTGKTRKFLSGGDPADRQLVVYACALHHPVAGLGLFNVDSRETSVDGAGPAFAPIDDWGHTLIVWKQQVRAAAEKIATGDVRLRLSQASHEARPLSLLSRFFEVRREA